MSPPGQNLKGEGFLERPDLDASKNRLQACYEKQWGFVLESIQDFGERHRDSFRFAARAHSALNLVENIRCGLGLGIDGEVTPEPSQLPPAFVADVLDWQARGTLFHYYFRAQNGAGGLSKDVFKRDLFARRDRVFDDLAQFDQVFGTDPAVYETMLDGFHLSRLVLRGPQDEYLRQDRAIDTRVLGENLAIYKIVTGLQNNGFPQTRRISPEDESQKAHATIPMEGWGNRSLLIMIEQISKAKDWHIERISNRTVLAQLPVEIDKTRPFDISAKNIQTLDEAIYAQIRDHKLTRYNLGRAGVASSTGSG